MSSKSLRHQYLNSSAFFTYDILLGNQESHPLNLQRHNFGEFHTLYHHLRKYPSKFCEYSRMSIQTFDYILERIRKQIEKMDTNFKKSVTPEEKLFITLRYLSTGLAFRSLAFSFRMGKTTISSIIYETCEAIWKILVKDHMPEPSAMQLQTVSEEYYEKWQFPNCIGSIDGKHCRLTRPANSGSQYFNYRKFFSINLQAVADANKKFITIEVGGRGRQSDGGTFQYSKLNTLIEKHKFNIPPPQKLPGTNVVTPMVLIGDEAYPLKNYLMRPYPERVLDNEKEIFNKRLSRARKCIECAFGLLCAKWRILNKSIETNTTHACLIIKTTCLLHNIVRDNDGDTDTHYITMTHTHNDNMVDQQQPRRQNKASAPSAQLIRTKFKDFFVNN